MLTPPNPLARIEPGEYGLLILHCERSISNAQQGVNATHPQSLLRSSRRARKRRRGTYDLSENDKDAF